MLHDWTAREKQRQQDKGKVWDWILTLGNGEGCTISMTHLTNFVRSFPTRTVPPWENSRKSRRSCSPRTTFSCKVRYCDRWQICTCSSLLGKSASRLLSSRARNLANAAFIKRCLFMKRWRVFINYYCDDEELLYNVVHSALKSRDYIT